jgi:hypothetical protein
MLLNYDFISCVPSCLRLGRYVKYSRAHGSHAEYPAVSVSRKLLTPPQINAITASREGSQSEALLTRRLYVDKGGKPGSYCLSLTMRAQW